MRLKNKRALITAAAQGIGRATAEAFVREGAEVFATDINMDLLADLEGAETFALDAMDRASIEAGAERARPDVIFNCAGFVHAGTLLEASDEDFDFAMGLNVKSMVRMIRAALPGMIERGGGSIVNVSSVASSIVGAPNRAIYGTSKAAVIGLTKSVAVDFVTQGIRCNAVCPGTVESPSLQQRLRDTGDYDAALKAFIARQPMGRIATADEIASLVVYLASDESAFVTGQTFTIDGGWSVA
ncbi:MAG: SDR family oxidoreductase [Pseudomonadota bacterium]